MNSLNSLRQARQTLVDESAHFSVDKVVYRPLTYLITHLSTQICGI